MVSNAVFHVAFHIRPKAGDLIPIHQNATYLDVNWRASVRNHGDFQSLGAVSIEIICPYDNASRCTFVNFASLASCASYWPDPFFKGVT